MTKPITFTPLVVAVTFAMSLATTAHALNEMSDAELSNATAQGEFLTVKQIGTNELGNPNDNVAFTRLTLGARVDINANINKLRFGCDNSDLTDCDISIDNVILSGKVPSKKLDGSENNFPVFGSVAEKLSSTQQLNTQFVQTKDGAASTDFVMNNPFLELAIQNPESTVDRKLVGYRFGAHEVWGSMSTGDGPTKENGAASPVEIFGPESCDNTNDCSVFDTNQPMKSYGSGLEAIDNLYAEIKNSVYDRVRLIGGDRVCNNGTTCEAERERRFVDVTKKWLSYSNGLGHTGVNSISGRLPVRLDNFNLDVRVKDVKLGNVLNVGDAEAQTAIVSGNLNRANDSDFGTIAGGGNDPTGNYDSGYLRNVFQGDGDTEYNTATHGNYVANDTRVGRAPTFKRASAATLKGMIVNIHNVRALGGVPVQIGTGDRFNNQTINTNLFHQLEFGSGDIYTEGQGAKNFAFQYQTLDGLQWITTDKRFGNQYDQYGNVVKGQEKSVNGGYDWLSTRAGWWLESPTATVTNAFVPKGQILNQGNPEFSVPIKLGNIDLGARAVDNCYGNLTFC